MFPIRSIAGDDEFQVCGDWLLWGRLFAFMKGGYIFLEKDKC